MFTSGTDCLPKAQPFCHPEDGFGSRIFLAPVEYYAKSLLFLEIDHCRQTHFLKPRAHHLSLSLGAAVYNY